MNEEERMALIRGIIEEVRPMIQLDGGDIEFLGIEGERIQVRMGGACSHCGSAFQTLGMIRKRIMQETGKPFFVVPA